MPEVLFLRSHPESYKNIPHRQTMQCRTRVTSLRAIHRAHTEPTCPSLNLVPLKLHWHKRPHSHSKQCGDNLSYISLPILKVRKPDARWLSLLMGTGSQSGRSNHECWATVLPAIRRANNVQTFIVGRLLPLRNINILPTPIRYPHAQRRRPRTCYLEE